MQASRDIRLGGHGLPVGPDDPEAFARAHRAFGYRAAYCPPVAPDDAPRLAAIERAFAEADVVIAEIGIWRNLIAVEPATRAANLAHACDCLAIADAVGAGCAVSYIGSFEPETDYAPHPRNMGPDCFEATVETVRAIIDRVRPRRARFALEMMQYSLPDSVESYLDLIRAIDRPAFAAHVDPVNLVMTPRVYFDTGALIRDIFDRLGPHIVSCHAKDILLHHRAALHFDEVMIGDGVLDYRTYLAEVARAGVPLMLEHLEGAEYAKARDRLVAVGREVGVGF
jgi:sugar phosphate isomerase/epimerase